MFVRDSAAPVAKQNDTSGCRAPGARRPCRRETPARDSRCSLRCVQRRAVADDGFGHRVREVRAVAERRRSSRSPSPSRCRSSTMRLRGCDVPCAALASLTNSRWIGRATSTSFATCTTAPSSMNAVLSAVNVCAVVRGDLAEVLLDEQRQLVVRARERQRASRRPAAPPRSTAPASKRPFTNTSVCQSVAPNANGASCAAVTSPLGGASRRELPLGDRRDRA